MKRVLLAGVSFAALALAETTFAGDTLPPIERLEIRRSLGIGILAAAAMVAVIPGEAAAKHSRHIHHHVMSRQIQDAQASSAPQATSVSPMRYYGGSKSPMWR